MSPTNIGGRHGITRRRLLGGALAGTAVLAGVPTPARADSPPVEPLASADISRHLAAITGDREAITLHRDLISDGWDPAVHRAVGHRAAPESIDEPYDVVAIAYTDQTGDDQAVLLWAASDSVPTRTYRISDSDASQAELKTTVADGRHLHTDVIRFDPSIWWWFCSRVNWACVLSVAGAWAGTIAACGACIIDPSRLTCLACVGAAVSASGGTLGCSFCAR